MLLLPPTFNMDVIWASIAYLLLQKILTKNYWLQSATVLSMMGSNAIRYFLYILDTLENRVSHLSGTHYHALFELE